MLYHVDNVRVTLGCLSRRFYYVDDVSERLNPDATPRRQRPNDAELRVTLPAESVAPRRSKRR
jgi:hypothetical protein